MRFNCGPTKLEKYKAKCEYLEALALEVKQWHAVFLFWPRRMNDTHDCRLFETVERRYPDAQSCEDWFFPGKAHYRPIGGGS